MSIPGWLNKRYPQNYIIKNPLIGTGVFLIFCICFIIIYKPLQPQESRFFSYEVTAAIYCIIVSIPLFVLVSILKKIPFFSNPDEWTVLREILSTLISLFGMGITVYFAGFLLEPPDNRWNPETFFDSVLSAFLVLAVPFIIFSLANYRYLLVTDIIKSFTAEKENGHTEKTEEQIHIESQLKKEELSFYPSQFIYAESDGNYIIFHLLQEGKLSKKIIRNSISNIELQLSGIPYITRTHRAFIVNVKKVISQKGNTLAYRIKLEGIDQEIPVSRQKTKSFDQILQKFH